MIWTGAGWPELLHATLRGFYPGRVATLGSDLTDRDAVGAGRAPSSRRAEH